MFVPLALLYPVTHCYKNYSPRAIFFPLFLVPFHLLTFNSSCLTLPFCVLTILFSSLQKDEKKSREKKSNKYFILNGLFADLEEKVAKLASEAYVTIAREDFFKLHLLCWDLYLRVGEIWKDFHHFGARWGLKKAEMMNSMNVNQSCIEACCLIWIKSHWDGCEWWRGYSHRWRHGTVYRSLNT